MTRRQRSVGPRAAAATAFAVLIFIFANGLTPGLAETPVGCPAPPGPHILDPTVPLNLGQLKLELRDYRCFKYDDEVAAVLSHARAWVALRAPQVSNPAVVLDIDETSLSNWAEILHNDFGFIPGGACDLNSAAACGDSDWELSASATALQPTLDLFNAAKTKNVAVFFITGRFDKGLEKAATELNLTNAHYFGWDGLYLRDPNNPRASVAEYKRDARIDIESRKIHDHRKCRGSEQRFGPRSRPENLQGAEPFYFIP